MYWRDGQKMSLFLIMFFCACYILQVLSNNFLDQFLAFNQYLAIDQKQLWRFISYACIHSSGFILPIHLLTNMYSLYVTGPIFERFLSSSKMLTVFIFSVLGGSLFTAIVNFTNFQAQISTWVIGASGGVFGLFAGLLIIFKRIGADLRQIGAVLVINMIIMFTIPGIAWQAHVGGALVGLGFTAFFTKVRFKF